MHPVYSIGHSTRSLDELIALLIPHDIELLTDVRRFPASRRHPQFNRETLQTALPAAHIEYLWIEDLGGRRAARKDSHNMAWRNSSFRGYADYMETADYQRARDALAELALRVRTAVMCAEAVWWQCHRGLIADDFKARGWTVLHLLSPGRIDEHPWTGAARIVDGRLRYREPDTGELFG